MIYIILFAAIATIPFFIGFIKAFIVDIKKQRDANKNREKAAQEFCDKINSEAERRAYKWIFRKE